MNKIEKIKEKIQKLWQSNYKNDFHSRAREDLKILAFISSLSEDPDSPCEESISPIPISKDILEKMGFIRHYTGSYYAYGEESYSLQLLRYSCLMWKASLPVFS